MIAELVRAAASDGLRLDGAIFRPAATGESPVDAALLLHGVGGNFYSSSLLDAVQDAFLAAGVAVLRVNTRGHDGMYNAPTNQGARRFGAAFEIVDECRLDLAAWTDFLRNEGLARIALVGHSLGAIKAIYAAANTDEMSCIKIAALSPPRLAYCVFQKSGNPAFQEAIARAEAFVEDGRPHELMPVRFPFPLIISAASYVDKYGREERYDIVRHVPKLSCPILFLYGEKELSEGGPPFSGIDRAVAEAARPDQSLEVRIVPGADHFYNGVQETAAVEVAAWLQK
jgi:pimeloyl-ACP methyl ester carboxylesterase